MVALLKERNFQISFKKVGLSLCRRPPVSTGAGLRHTTAGQSPCPLRRVHTPVAPRGTTPGVQTADQMAAMPGPLPSMEAGVQKTTHRSVPKGAWTKEEDETVMRLVGLYGPTR